MSVSPSISPPHPRDSDFLVGYEPFRADFFAAQQSGKLPHAWILAGAKGTGKATLAYSLARSLLVGADTPVEAGHPVFRRIAARSHGDLLTVEPAYDEKKEEQKSEITAEAARGIGSFLSLTPSESRWRVVIIDSADELNVTAANAILKTLEEPPPGALLLLISHNPGRLLPTIRSRCRMAGLPPLTEGEYSKVMGRIAPEAEKSLLEKAGQLARHSPGQALQLIGQGGLEAYGGLCALLARLPAIPAKDVLAFADSFGGKQPHARWRQMGEMAMLLMQRIVVPQTGEAAAGEGALRTKLLSLAPPSYWVECHERAASEFSLAAKLHLDYKTVAINFLETLNKELKAAHA